MKFIVLWHNRGRIGSLEHTSANIKALKDKYHLMLLQRDYTGTEHYEVSGPRRKR